MTMKTTFDLPEPLVKEVKQLARERGTTSRALVQQALRRLIDEAKASSGFHLEDVSVTGWASMNPAARGVPLSELIHQASREQN
jgi:hypothetical protein